uniref:Transposase n=1 Tax=Mesocestoides corti TaxID=53468 RepID=A0A5K3EIA6_MESCO
RDNICRRFFPGNQIKFGTKDLRSYQRTKTGRKRVSLPAISSLEAKQRPAWLEVDGQTLRCRTLESEGYCTLVQRSLSYP